MIIWPKNVQSKDEKRNDVLIPKNHGASGGLTPLDAPPGFSLVPTGQPLTSLPILFILIIITIATPLSSMTESRLFGLSILPNGIHRSDTVGEINTTSVLKNGTHLDDARSLLLLTMSSKLMNSWNRPDFS